MVSVVMELVTEVLRNATKGEDSATGLAGKEAIRLSNINSKALKKLCVSPLFLTYS